MRPRSSSGTRLTVLTLVFVTLSLAVAVIPLASLSTYAAVSVLLLALLIVTANTMINDQPTGSLGQLLHDTERRQSVSSPRTNVRQVYRW